MAHRLSHSKKNLYGPTLRVMRLTAGLTQAALAKKLQLGKGSTKAGQWDVDEVVISYIENGKRMLTDIELSMFLSALGLKLSDLEREFDSLHGDNLK